MVTSGGVLAVVPARGGSRGVPGKNLRVVAGRPLIVWTILSAQRAASLQRIVISTDSPEIAEIGRNCGAEVPELRPPELARDDTPGVDPVLHMLSRLQTLEGYRPDAVMLLQPTSPLRTAEDIDAACELQRQSGADSVVSVCPVTQHPAWMKRLGRSGELLETSDSDALIPRQQLPPLFVLNGAIYLARTPTLLETRSFYGDDSRAYVMPTHRSLDIDTVWDLHIADLALRFPFHPTA